jgi:hypothetical protein
VSGSPATFGDREIVASRESGAPVESVGGAAVVGAGLVSSPADEEGDGVVWCGGMFFLFFFVCLFVFFVFVFFFLSR